MYSLNFKKDSARKEYKKAGNLIRIVKKTLASKIFYIGWSGFNKDDYQNVCGYGLKDKMLPYDVRKDKFGVLQAVLRFAIENSIGTEKAEAERSLKLIDEMK